MTKDNNIREYTASTSKTNWFIGKVVYSAENINCPVMYIDSCTAKKSAQTYFSSPLDQLAHLFLNAFDNSIDVSERTSNLILQLQQFVNNKEFDLLNLFLSHNQASKLHPSIILGALFITENIAQLNEAWIKLNKEFGEKMCYLNESINR